MDELDPRVRAVCDLNVAEAREYGGRHEYDGVPQDLSPDGVAPGWPGSRRPGSRPPPDPHDEAHLRAFEELQRVIFAPTLSCTGAIRCSTSASSTSPATTRTTPRGGAGRGAGRAPGRLAAVIDAAIASLDQVSAPVAESLLGGIRGLAAGSPRERAADPEARDAALAAHGRLVAHVERRRRRAPDAALGRPALTALLCTAEALTVDLGALAAQADAERDRLRARLDGVVPRVGPTAGEPGTWRASCRGTTRTGRRARGGADWTERAIEFTRDRDLMPVHDGACLVGAAPESRRWAMAMISTNAPAEPDAPSWYWITPPDESWPAEEVEAWLEVFSATTLPAITVHEVAPGHFSHHQALRRARGDVRRTLFSSAFVEGWAHYAEELCVEEGFLADDPRLRDRGLARGAGPGDPAGVRARRAHRRAGRSRKRPRGSRPTPT